MNEIQINLQSIVSELFSALQKNSDNPMGGFDDAIQNMSGIRDGSFFDLPFDIQCDKLQWLYVTFFGRGERGLVLFDVGLLPDDFDTKFHAVYDRYRNSHHNLTDK